MPLHPNSCSLSISLHVWSKSIYFYTYPRPYYQFLFPEVGEVNTTLSYYAYSCFRFPLAAGILCRPWRDRIAERAPVRLSLNAATLPRTICYPALFRVKWYMNILVSFTAKWSFELMICIICSAARVFHFYIVTLFRPIPYLYEINARGLCSNF